MSKRFSAMDTVDPVFALMTRTIKSLTRERSIEVLELAIDHFRTQITVLLDEAKEEQEEAKRS